MICTNCHQPSPTDYCADCEQFRERLEKLRADQQQRLRDMRSGKIKSARPQKRVGAWFRDQCLRAGLAATGESKLPLSGQDAALPPGDRWTPTTT